MDPFTTFNGEQYLKQGLCPLCYFRDNRVVKVSEAEAESRMTRKAVEHANEHMATVHRSTWRYLGEQGRATLLLADVCQLAEHPETVEEMYETLMDGMKKDNWGFPSRQFRSGTLTHDVQAVIVNESGGSDMGSITFGRVDPETPSRFVEVRVLWDDRGLREDDKDFVEFFVGVSNILYLFDFTIDEIKGYLRIS